VRRRTAKRRQDSDQKEKMKKSLLARKGMFGLMMLMLAVFGMLAPASQAAFSTNLTDIVTDATTLFGSVQTLAITIISFSIAVWVIRKVKR